MLNSFPSLARLCRGAAPAVLATLAALIPACSPPTPPAPPADPAPPEGPAGPPLFEDVTRAAGIDFTYRNGEEAGHLAIIESLGGGVALFDFDKDGRVDVFFTGGGRYEGKTVHGNPCRLYRNLGGWKFEDVSKKVGLEGPFQYSHGAAAFDYDCDGWGDLLLTGYNRLVLLHNESDGQGGRRFVDVTQKVGLTERLWSSTAAWGDLDGDGFPELYVSHYGDWGFGTNHPDCTYDGKTPDVCQPRRFKPLPHLLYRNDRGKTFTDVTAQQKLRKDGRGMGVLFVDVNGDARPDVYVANDTDDNYLYMNRGKRGELSLEEAGLFAGVARDDRGQANGSMGVDAADYDRSGQASIVVTNYEGELPALYQNRTAAGGPPRFIYATLASGIAAIGGVYVGWGTGFIDFDHDGWEDLLIVNGHAIRYPIKIDRRQKPVLLRNESGRFQEITRQGGAYFQHPHNARGVAFADLDNDGKVDAVISHLNEPVTVLRNVAPTEGRHWVGVELLGEKHRDVVGARVVIESASGKQTRFAKGGGSFGSTHDRRQVVGLGGDSGAVAATVYWPSGKVQQFAGLAPDCYWRLQEGEGPAQRVTPPKP